MSSQPVEANVVLTADNSGYDQAMNQSAGSTTQLMNAVDSLTAKVSKMTKVAGKSLIGITAADTAVIAGATKAWNDYEKQMERLRSQSAVLARTNDQQNKVMKDYTASVKTLRNEFGTTTSEAAKLVETLSKVTTLRQTRELQDLSKVFVEMSAATGESSQGLASSLTNLQKVMGTPINAKTTREYADTFTYLAAQTNTTAGALMDFTAQLAPVAKSLGMNTRDVAGFATAFTRAGQEGGSAALAFTKVTGDMLKSLQSGSPEMAHYANMVDMTRGQFTKLAKDDSAEAVVRIFEALSHHSRVATTELNRLGLDGPRTIRSITSIASEPGGIRAALGLAEDPRARGATSRGYQATLEGLSDEFAKIQENLKQTAEAFATYLGPAIEVFLRGMEKASAAVEKITEGPMGKFLQLVAGMLAPLAGGAGLLLLFAGALIKVASAFTLLRSSAAYGVREGFKGGAALTRTGVDETGRSIYGPMGAGAMGKRGAQLAEEGTWVQRGLYNVGAFAGQGLGAFRRGGAVPESWYQTREALSRHIPWTSQYARPEEPSSLSSLVSRGAGYTVRNFLTPTFDQMRFADPTKRTQWAEREAPWIRGADKLRLLSGREGLVARMGQVGLAETQMVAQRAEYAKAQQDPMLSNQAREARLQEIRDLHRETVQRRNAAVAQETAIRKEIAQRGEASAATAAASRETVTFGRALRGLGANVGGGILGAGRAGAGAFIRSPMAGPVGAMGAMAGMSMLGIDNPMLMGAATGAMVGSMIPGIGTVVGGGIGAGVGAITEAMHANDSAMESIKNLNAAATDAARTGSGLSELNQLQTESTQSLQDYTKQMEDPGLGKSISAVLMPVFNAKTIYGGVANTVEGIFGKSNVDEAGDAYDTAAGKVKNLQGAMEDMARAGGTKLTGTDENKRKQVEAWMQSTGMAQLGAAGIDLDQLAAARGAGSVQYEQMLAKATTPGKSSGMWDRARTTEAGEAMLDSRTARRAIRLQGDVALFYDATNEVFSNMRKQGMSYLEIIKSTEKAQQRIGDENSREYEIQMAMSQKAQYALQMQAPQIGRAATFTQQLQLGATVMGIKPRTQEQAQQIEQQKQMTVQAVADNDAYFRSLLLAQQAYERSRARAQEDYNLQRQYQEYDYNLQRTRAEENFNRMRARAVADYHRSMTRAWDDFHLQRNRQEEDYRHQIEVTAQQQAIGMNLYQRVDTQRTSSATWLLSNTQDILSRLREQKQNLNKLRELGFSDAVIQQLQLTDPSNAQELSRFVAEVERDRSMVGKFNRTARRLQGATKALGTDESNLDFQEMQRQFRLSRTRGLADMNRSMDRQRSDFRRGLHQQREDFNIMMDQQAEDYTTQMNRQEKQYRTTMHRAAVDMSHMADEITGSIESVLVRAHRRLTGSAKEQAGIALQSFRDLKRDSSAEAVALMTELADIFGFKYTAPKGAKDTGSSGSSGPAPGNATSADMGSAGYSATAGQTYYAGGYGGPSGGLPNSGMNQGGVVPGYTPDRDTHTIAVGGGEAIMRPEWVRAIGGEKAIAAMNHAAKYGKVVVQEGFAAGGVVNPDRRVYMDGEPLSKIAAAQVLLAEKLSKLNFSIMQGSWQPYSSYSGSSHMGPGVLDAAPGDFTTQYWLRRVGFAAWGRNFPGAATAGSGAHVHAVSRIDPGASGHAQLSSFARGEDGLGGPDYGPNPPLEPGLMQMLAQFGDLALSTGSPSGGAAMKPREVRRMVQRQVLKDMYARAERSAAHMSGVHPLKPGMISTIINRFAKHKIREMVHKYGGVSGAPPGAVLEPTVAAAQKFARSHLADYGWGGGQMSPLVNLWNRESGWHWNADNPNSSAYGIPQALPGSKMASAGADWKTNAATQVKWGLGYIKDRYGSPAAAWAHSNAYNWYGDGAMFDRPNVIGVGERGPEAVIPLNDAGGEFLARSIGLSTLAGHGGSMSVHNYRIDRSTNFTGPITVQANDPNELLAKLQARQRVRALSRPSLTGSAA